MQCLDRPCTIQHRNEISAEQDCDAGFGLKILMLSVKRKLTGADISAPVTVLGAPVRDAVSLAHHWLGQSSVKVEDSMTPQMPDAIAQPKPTALVTVLNANQPAPAPKIAPKAPPNRSLTNIPVRSGLVSVLEREDQTVGRTRVCKRFFLSPTNQAIWTRSQ